MAKTKKIIFEEDRVREELAEERDKKEDKFLSHDAAWSVNV